MVLSTTIEHHGTPKHRLGRPLAGKKFFAQKKIRWSIGHGWWSMVVDRWSMESTKTGPKTAPPMAWKLSVS